MVESIKPLPGTTIDPRFPDEDGRFKGETGYHTKAVAWLYDALQDCLYPKGDWFVSSNLMFYWNYDSPRQRRDPDILVARGVGRHMRRAFRAWEEGTLPCVLMEVVSRRTRYVDKGAKLQQYEQVGIREYFLFDPEAYYLKPALQGFRLRKGIYVPIRPDKEGSLKSQQLGLLLRVEGIMLRLIDLKTWQRVLTRSEVFEQIRMKRERLAEEEWFRACRRLQQQRSNG